MGTYEQGYDEGHDSGYQIGYDQGRKDEEHYMQQEINAIEQEKADMEWDYNKERNDLEKERDEITEALRQSENAEEVLSNDFHELELKHDKLDEKFEDVLWEIKQSWPEVIFDLQMKGVL